MRQTMGAGRGKKNFNGGELGKHNNACSARQIGNLSRFQLLLPNEGRMAKKPPKMRSSSLCVCVLQYVPIYTYRTLCLTRRSFTWAQSLFPPSSKRFSRMYWVLGDGWLPSHLRILCTWLPPPPRPLWNSTVFSHIPLKIRASFSRAAHTPIPLFLI